MKLEMIGTGSIWSSSNSACTLINESILVDIPNGVCKALIKSGHDLNKINCCIITHLHGDHYFDIPFLLKFLENQGRETPFKIIGVSGIEDTIKNLVELAFKDNYEKIKENLKLEYINAEDLKLYKLYEDIVITSYVVEHSDKYKSYGYLIENDGLSVGFTGDARMCDGVRELFEKSDILVADTSLEKGSDSHMGIDNIVELAEKKANKTIVATHMKDETKKAAVNIKNKNIIIPSDGFTIELSKVAR